MTSQDFAERGRRLGFTNRDAFAAWLGVSARAADGYALGTAKVPHYVARALRLAEQLQAIAAICEDGERSGADRLDEICRLAAVGRAAA